MKTYLLKFFGAASIALGLLSVIPGRAYSVRPADWATSLRNSPRAQKVLKQLALQAKKKRFGPDGFAWKPTAKSTTIPSHAPVAGRNLPTQDPVEAERVRAYYAYLDPQIKAYEALARSGRLGEARSKCLALLKNDPTNPFLCRDMADIDFQLNNYDEAYKVLLPAATPRQTQVIMLRLSLAASRTGQVFPGQREYCLAYLKSMLTGGGGPEEEFMALMPQGNTPNEVAFLSHMAVGYLN